jgi:alkanesulfonate monooxygenase SsuD/methylene tetrahydromethanopterin reductase-like flavin-dependent oxidoreductase (luciferase family)
VRLGINLPSRQPDGNAPTVAQIMARAALIERVGFDGIWIGDTVGRQTTPTPDALAWLLAAAAGTQRLELGTAVIQVPLRQPVELAQRLMTLHALSGGRFRAGLGAGSTQTDFDAVGVDFAERFHTLSEALPVIQRLCRGERVGEALLHPWPDTAGGPPILIGGWHSRLWLKRAALAYDGWLASAAYSSFNGLREGLKRYRDAGGKRALVATTSVDLSAPEAPFDANGRFSLVCGPESAAERLGRLAELGFDDVLLTRGVHSEADLDEATLRAIRALVPRHGPHHVAAQRRTED